MITLFENITEQLTDKEKNVLVPLIIERLQLSNQHYTIKSYMLQSFLAYKKHKVSDARIRKMIAYIRIMNLTKPKALIGSSKGYFLTKNLQVVDDQIESLKGRMAAMKCVVESLEAQKENLKHAV
jgi:hypothetical protein